MKMRAFNAAAGAGPAIPSSAGKDGWFHLAPFGTYPGYAIVRKEDGAELRVRCQQLIDAEAMASILTGFEQDRNAAGENWRGLLLDRDHLSAAGTPITAAMGRILDLQVRGDGKSRTDGLWCKISFTRPGEAAVRDREYSHLSLDADVVAVEADADGNPKTIRPVHLNAAALTNNPQLPVRVMNAAGNQQPAASADPAASKEPTPGQPGSTKGQRVNYKLMLLTLLGLAEAATDAEIQAAFDGREGMTIEDAKGMKVKCSALTGEVAELKLGKEADAFIEANKTRIADPTTVRNAYIKDAAGTKLLFSGLTVLPGAQRSAQVLNGGTKPPPGATQSEADALVRDREAYLDKLQRDLRVRNRSEAHSMAVTLRPDLFATT